jgi:CheY-like chemotaxis protein
VSLRAESQDTSSRPYVLLLEDEVLIALNLQEELQELGFRVAGPFTTCAAALDWLRTGTPDVAILDAVLKDGPCREIALELAHREAGGLLADGLAAGPGEPSTAAVCQWGAAARYPDRSRT